jgi:hypothetical protein
VQWLQINTAIHHHHPLLHNLALKQAINISKTNTVVLQLEVAVAAEAEEAITIMEVEVISTLHLSTIIMRVVTMALFQ